LAFVRNAGRPGKTDAGNTHPQFDVAVIGNVGIDTNGARDSLAVGFLSSFVLDKYPLPASILWGQIAARYSCAQKASSSDLITPDKLARYF
jgi:sugar/nucleoside kinase (ribokinase family)